MTFTLTCNSFFSDLSLPTRPPQPPSPHHVIPSLLLYPPDRTRATHTHVLGSLVFFRLSSAFSSAMPTWQPSASRVLGCGGQGHPTQPPGPWTPLPEPGSPPSPVPAGPLHLLLWLSGCLSPSLCLGLCLSDCCLSPFPCLHISSPVSTFSCPLLPPIPRLSLSLTDQLSLCLCYSFLPSSVSASRSLLLTSSQAQAPAPQYHPHLSVSPDICRL